MLPLPLQFIIAMVVYAINERMARRVDYLLEEVRERSEVIVRRPVENGSLSLMSNGAGLPSKERR